jgi:hypothetical protein
MSFLPKLVSLARCQMMNLSSVNVHGETLQLASIKSLSDNSDAFGNKLMCILKYLSTF